MTTFFVFVGLIGVIVLVVVLFVVPKATPTIDDAMSKLRTPLGTLRRWLDD